MINGQSQNSPAQSLMPYTGYYALDGIPGGFVMIDSHSTWAAGEGGGAPTVDYFAKISISSDGEMSETYELGPDCTFDGSHLVITGPDGTNIAHLTFTGAGGVCTMQGTLGGTAVQGTTPFGPVETALWAGTYYEQEYQLTDKIYLYRPALIIEPDGTVLYSTEGELQPMPAYWYDYGMFVFGLEPTPGGKSILYEMGTSSGWGRVAGNASDGSMLVSIRLQEPAPHL